MEVDVSAVGPGAWNVGPSWGDVSDEQAKEAIRTALDADVNLLDTAEVYGDGRTERLIGESRRKLRPSGREGCQEEQLYEHVLHRR